MRTKDSDGGPAEKVPVVAVAVAFDDGLSRLLHVGVGLARRLGARLKLVHVCDPWTRSYLAPAVEAGPPELVQALRDDVLATAERRIGAVRAALLASGNEDLTVEATVLDGDIIRDLAADTDASGASLLLVGVQSGGLAGTAIGYSTAVGLIAAGSVPVLTLNETARWRDGREAPWTILVADDFTDVAGAALRLAFELAGQVPQTRIVHLHVETHAEVGKRRRPAGRDRTELTAESFHAARRTAEQRLLRRSAELPRALSAAFEAQRGTYHAEVVVGSVPEEVARTIAAYRADLAVFGQHRPYHREPAEGRAGAYEGHVGQVPFKAMLSLACPVIVVPQ